MVIFLSGYGEFRFNLLEYDLDIYREWLVVVFQLFCILSYRVY